MLMVIDIPDWIFQMFFITLSIFFAITSLWVFNRILLTWGGKK